MSFELPHENDFATDTKLPGYLTENAVAIEQEDAELRKLIKESNDDLSQKIDELNKRFDELMNGGGM